ncbi:hypothetical protein SCANM124S_00204 [Streptomyces canus]
MPDRQALCGILFVLHTGIQWEYLPQELGFGSGMTCWRHEAFLGLAVCLITHRHVQRLCQGQLGGRGSQQTPDSARAAPGWSRVAYRQQQAAGCLERSPRGGPLPTSATECSVCPGPLGQRYGEVMYWVEGSDVMSDEVNPPVEEERLSSR